MSQPALATPERIALDSATLAECIALADQMVAEYHDAAASELDADFAFAAGLEAFKAAGLEEYADRLRALAAPGGATVPNQAGTAPAVDAAGETG